jgi:hypothetical protein
MALQTTHCPRLLPVSPLLRPLQALSHAHPLRKFISSQTSEAVAQAIDRATGILRDTVFEWKQAFLLPSASRTVFHVVLGSPPIRRIIPNR